MVSNCVFNYLPAFPLSLFSCFLSLADLNGSDSDQSGSGSGSGFDQSGSGLCPDFDQSGSASASGTDQSGTNGYHVSLQPSNVVVRPSDTIALYQTAVFHLTLLVMILIK